MFKAWHNMTCDFKGYTVCVLAYLPLSFSTDPLLLFFLLLFSFCIVPTWIPDLWSPLMLPRDQLCVQERNHSDQCVDVDVTEDP